MTNYVSKGYRNSGYDNTGSLNAGDGNSGDFNFGSYNSGHRNYGSYNSGDFNLGNSNSGDWNQAEGCNGVFCTSAENIYIFNRPSNLTLQAWRKSKAYQILSRVRTTRWVARANMSLRERLANSEYKLAGGYLKAQTLKEGCAELWSQLTDEEKNEIYSIPNFDGDIFREITGIQVGVE